MTGDECETYLGTGPKQLPELILNTRVAKQAKKLRTEPSSRASCSAPLWKSGCDCGPSPDEQSRCGLRSSLSARLTKRSGDWKRRGRGGRREAKFPPPFCVSIYEWSQPSALAELSITAHAQSASRTPARASLGKGIAAGAPFSETELFSGLKGMSPEVPGCRR